MLTDDDVIADLARLRERSAGIDYTGEVPLTRRSAAATIVPVAAVAAVATVGAVALTGTDHGGVASRPSRTPSATAAVASPTPDAPPTRGAIKLVSAKITLGGRTIAYRHAVGEDPFGDGWQLAVELGGSLPADATRFDLGGGELVWVADSPDAGLGASMLVVQAGPHHAYVGAPSSFTRADLEEFVRTSLHGR